MFCTPSRKTAWAVPSWASGWNPRNCTWSLSVSSRIQSRMRMPDTFCLKMFNDVWSKQEISSIKQEVSRICLTDVLTLFKGLLLSIEQPDILKQHLPSPGSISYFPQLRHTHVVGRLFCTGSSWWRMEIQELIMITNFNWDKLWVLEWIMMIGTNNDYLEIDKHICWTMIVLAYVILDSCMSYPYLTKIPTSWCPRYLGKLSLLSEIECKKHQETILGIFSPIFQLSSNRSVSHLPSDRNKEFGSFRERSPRVSAPLCQKPMDFAMGHGSVRRFKTLKLHSHMSSP